MGILEKGVCIAHIFHHQQNTVVKMNAKMRQSQYNILGVGDLFRVYFLKVRKEYNNSSDTLLSYLYFLSYYDKWYVVFSVDGRGTKTIICTVCFRYYYLQFLK